MAPACALKPLVRALPSSPSRKLYERLEILVQHLPLVGTPRATL